MVNIGRQYWQTTELSGKRETIAAVGPELVKLQDLHDTDFSSQASVWAIPPTGAH